MISEEECIGTLSYLYLDHIRRNDDDEDNWGLSLCLLEFAYNLIVDSGHGCPLGGCECELCVSRNEAIKHGKEFLEVGE